MPGHAARGDALPRGQLSNLDRLPIANRRLPRSAGSLPAFLFARSLDRTQQPQRPGQATAFYFNEFDEPPARPQHAGEEKANRDTKLLETSVTPRKQTTAPQSNRDKTRHFRDAICTPARPYRRAPHATGHRILIENQIIRHRGNSKKTKDATRL